MPIIDAINGYLIRNNYPVSIGVVYRILLLLFFTVAFGVAIERGRKVLIVKALLYLSVLLLAISHDFSTVVFTTKLLLPLVLIEVIQLELGVFRVVVFAYAVINLIGIAIAPQNTYEFGLGLYGFYQSASDLATFLGFSFIYLVRISERRSLEMIQLCIIALSTILIGSRVAIALILTGLIIWFLYLSLAKKIYCYIGMIIVSAIFFNRLEVKDSDLKYNLLKFSTLVSSEDEYNSPRKKALNAFSKIINDNPVVFLLKGFGYDSFRLKLSKNTGFANSLHSSEGKHAELDLVDISGSLGVVATLIILYGYLAALGRIYWKASVFVLGAVAGHVFFNTIMLVFWIGINEKVRFSYWNRELE